MKHHMRWSAAIGLAGLLVLGAASTVVEAKQARSGAAKAEFLRQHPCPATGQPKGKCPGYVIDHVVPLCASGPDQPSTMQWQTVADAKL